MRRPRISRLSWLMLLSALFAAGCGSQAEPISHQTAGVGYPAPWPRPQAEESRHAGRRDPARPAEGFAGLLNHRGGSREEARPSSGPFFRADSTPRSGSSSGSPVPPRRVDDHSLSSILPRQGRIARRLILGRFTLGLRTARNEADSYEPEAPASESPESTHSLALRARIQCAHPNREAL